MHTCMCWPISSGYSVHRVLRADAYEFVILMSRLFDYAFDGGVLSIHDVFLNYCEHENMNFQALYNLWPATIGGA